MLEEGGVYLLYYSPLFWVSFYGSERGGIVKIKIGFVKTIGRHSGLDFSVTSTPTNLPSNVTIKVADYE